MYVLMSYQTRCLALAVHGLKQYRAHRAYIPTVASHNWVMLRAAQQALWQFRQVYPSDLRCLKNSTIKLWWLPMMMVHSMKCSIRLIRFAKAAVEPFS